MKEKTRFGIIMYATAVIIACIYAPQPILKTLGAAFSASAGEASLSMTMVMLPMALAPILYGFVLESVPARPILLTALCILAVCQFASACMDTLGGFLAIRFVEGLCFPALLVVLMTSAAENTGGRSVRASLSMYVATTITGGLLGRILSGLAATAFGWRGTFILTGVAATIALVLLLRLPASRQASFSRPRLDLIPEFLARPGFLRFYSMIFCVFFLFMSIFNILPFRLAELSQGISEFKTSLGYCGFLVGLVITQISVRLSDLLGGKVGTLRLGMIVFIGSLPLFHFAGVGAYVAGIFVFCAGFFFIHSLGPGFLATRASDHRPLANGLYMSFFYAGGALGSYLPSLVYQHLGHDWYLAILLAFMILALVLCPSQISNYTPPDRHKAARA